jgi:hypothetical protein
MTTAPRTNSVQAAADWLRAQSFPPHPLIPALKARFGLSAKEACEAIASARSEKEIP